MALRFLPINLGLFFSFSDNERPNITCPSETTIPTDYSSSLATYTLPQPSVSDNTEDYTVTIMVGDISKSIGENSTLNLTDGVTTLHTILYAAIDQYGNTMSCYQNVTVIGK